MGPLLVVNFGGLAEKFAIIALDISDDKFVILDGDADPLSILDRRTVAYCSSELTNSFERLLVLGG